MEPTTHKWIFILNLLCMPSVYSYVRYVRTELLWKLILLLFHHSRLSRVLYIHFSNPSSLFKYMGLSHYSLLCCVCRCVWVRVCGCRCVVYTVWQLTFAFITRLALNRKEKDFFPWLIFFRRTNFALSNVDHNDALFTLDIQEQVHKKAYF